MRLESAGTEFAPKTGAVPSRPKTVLAGRKWRAEIGSSPHQGHPFVGVDLHPVVEKRAVQKRDVGGVVEIGLRSRANDAVQKLHLAPRFVGANLNETIVYGAGEYPQLHKLLFSDLMLTREPAPGSNSRNRLGAAIAARASGATFNVAGKSCRLRRQVCPRDGTAEVDRRWALG